MKIAVITACPGGIANSIIAAGLIEKAAAESEWTVAVECQSSVVPVKALSQAVIDEADCIVVVSNIAVDTTRFTGKKLCQVAIDDVLADPKAALSQGVSQATVLTGVTPVTPWKNSDSTTRKIVAVTACPTGVAHTFMAAEALEEEGKRQGHQIKVETRGSVGVKNS